MNRKIVIGAMAVIMIGFTVLSASAATIGYWRFEEASGDALDETTNQNGTVLGNAARSSTIFGSPVPKTGATNTQSMEFTGTAGDAVNMGQSVDVGTSDLTLEAWVNLRDALDFPLIAGKLISGNFLDRGWELMARPDAANGGGEAGPGKWKARFAIRHGGSQDQVLSADLDFNTWYHLAGVREGTGANAVKLYIDGVLAGTAASAHTELGSPQEFSVGGANITGGPPGSFGRAVNGFIDEVRLSDVALAPSQFHNIPEPGSAVLLLMGISVLLGFRKR